MSECCEHILKPKLSFRKWVHPDDLHITVQFLGDTPAPRIPDIQEQTASVLRDIASFQLKLTGIGAFGSPASPRVLWAGLGGVLQQLHFLQSQLSGALKLLGFMPEDRLYRPHLTLARTYTGTERPDMVSAIREAESALGDTAWTVDHIALYRTHMGRRPMYEAVARLPLSAGPI
jgi:2'-5' RNA ligase